MPVVLALTNKCGFIRLSFQSLDAYEAHFPSLLTLVLKSNSPKQPLGPIIPQEEAGSVNPNPPDSIRNVIN